MELIQLNTVCNFKQWKTIPTKELKDNGFPVWGANGIIGYSDEYNHTDPTIMICCRGATCGAINVSSGKCYINGNAMCVDNLSEEYTIDFVAYFLKHYDFSGIITGAAQPQITQNGLAKIFIPKMSIAEQNYIASNLQKIEKSITLKEQELHALDDLVKSRFIEMFGDPVENPKGWDKRPLSDECEIITGNTPSRKKSNYYGNFIEWIKSDNINTPNALLTPAAESLSKEGLKVGRSVEKDCILMTCIAGSIGCIGNVSVTDRKVAFNQQINGIIPNKNNVWFLYVLFDLSKSYIQSTVTMALKGILSKGQLSKIEFIFPPIEIQNEFAEFVKLIDKSKFVCLLIPSIFCGKSLHFRHPP